MPTPETGKGRRNVPLYIMLPPEERARLVDFADRVGRPLSWCVRDALRCYVDAVGRNAAKLARLRADLDAPALDLRRAGRTVQGKPGRPKARANVL